MSGPNNPILLDDRAAETFAAAQFVDQEPTDVDKTPLPEDGDQPFQDVLQEEPNV